MSTATRYSARLRRNNAALLGNGNNGNAGVVSNDNASAAVDNDRDDDDGDNVSRAATTTSRSRTALGNISEIANREGDNAAAGGKKGKKNATTKTTNGGKSKAGIVERVTQRRGRSALRRAAAVGGGGAKEREEEETEGKAAAAAAAVAPRPLRRAPSRRASASGRASAAKAAAAKKKKEEEAAKKKEEEEEEEAAKKKKRDAAARKKKKGTKRTSSSSSANDAVAGGRAAKRARKSSATSKSTEEDGRGRKKPVVRKSARSRSRSKSDPYAIARRLGAISKKTTRVDEVTREVVVEIVRADGGGGGDGDRVVPADFGLKRHTYDTSDPANLTYGIAYYDANDRDDPLRCKDYITDMFQNLYDAETTAHPRPYMDRQDDINSKMRAILIDWLVEVHMKFRLVPETLYLCVHIIDRYCSQVSVERAKLQLVGVTALFLASKHEEIYPPEVRDCVYITDRAYDRQEVLDMEQTLLRVLDWKVSLPTAYPFLDRFLSLTEASEMTRFAASYYLERTLQEHDLLSYRPSVVVASAVILALNNPDIRVQEREYDRELPGLPQILMEYTEFDKDQLMECMAVIARKVSEPAICASRRHLTAVKKKYEHRKYLSVSIDLELPSVQYVKQNTK